MAQRKSSPATKTRGSSDGSRAGARLVYEVFTRYEEDLGRAAREGIESDPELMRTVQQVQIRANPEEAAARQERTRATLRIGLLENDWGPYTAEVSESGETYAHAGLPFSIWSKVFTSYRGRFLDLLADQSDGDIRLFAAAADALGEFLDKSMGAVGDQYLKASEEIITRQQTAIRELSSPVLKVQPGLLVLPLIGIIDTDRARRFTSNLLNAIRNEAAHVVIIDLTGVPAVDSAVANHLLLAAKAARLLGAVAIITGISTANAETLVRLGVDLGELRALGDLESAIVEATAILAAPAAI